ncbi:MULTISPECIES: hypothetical protein [unclassified Saccharibacter]|uniref:hypothetical protein n=1 Tax=unclassified Saccharibacter TaxID=2648722 RepID=UPI00132C45A2|nr:MULTISPECIES: hypothetical protein [unclassified Saccharibacter]MXV35808.1 hypothetical protein [Saccharibacter sp. EH611]MXV57929.1 hypothetical protein [Saccharibacter sp. EH70]MXV66324.1 hypothetical protein [Saccharibacter sp. EH60]
MGEFRGHSKLDAGFEKRLATVNQSISAQLQVAQAEKRGTAFCRGIISGALSYFGTIEMALCSEDNHKEIVHHIQEILVKNPDIVALRKELSHD